MRFFTGKFLTTVLVITISGFTNAGSKSDATVQIPTGSVLLHYAQAKYRNGSYYLSGKVTNNSKNTTLKTFEVLVVVQDCEWLDDTYGCKVVSSLKTKLNVSVRPGEAKNFNFQVRHNAAVAKIKYVQQDRFDVIGASGVVDT